jgi:hypothetical protein
MPQPIPIAVMSWEMAVSLSDPETLEVLQTTSDSVQARMLMTTMISAATGTVYFSKVRIR